MLLHAAAYKHVPLVEANVCAGLSNNIFGTPSALDAAIACGLKRFTLISTDKVVRPTNVMGASKRVCELLVQDAAWQCAGLIGFVGAAISREDCERRSAHGWLCRDHELLHDDLFGP